MNAREFRDALGGSAAIARRALPLLAIGFLADTGFLFVYLVVLQSYLPESLHASTAIAGYALAAYGTAKLFTQVGAGMISDRIGTRRALIGGTALLVVSDVAIVPLGHSAPWFIVPVAAVGGLGASITWPAVYAAGATRFGAGEKARFTSMLTLATGLALLAGLGAGARVFAAVSFNAAMIFPIACTAAALAIALLTPLSAAEALHLEHAEPPSLSELRSVLSSAHRLAFACIVVVEASALGALTVIFRAYGRDVLGVSLTREEALLLPAAVLGAACVVAGGSLADRLGARRVMVPGFAVTGACLIMLARWTHPAFVVGVAGLAGAGFGLAAPSVASTMMALAGGAGSRGGVIGWFMTADGIGHAAGPALAGVLLAALGAHSVLITAGVLFLAVAVLASTQPLRENRVTTTPIEPARAPEPVTARHAISAGGEPS